jgi:hypothetical protein
MVYKHLRYFDLGLTNVKHTAFSGPQDLDALPQGELPLDKKDDDGEGMSPADSHDGDDPERLPSEPGDGHDVPDVMHTEGEEAPPAKRTYAHAARVQCGRLPLVQDVPLTLEHFLGLVPSSNGRSLEAKYAQDYATRYGHIFPNTIGMDAASRLAMDEDSDGALCISSDAAIAAAKQQHDFFKELDDYKLDDENAASSSTTATATAAAPGSWKYRLAEAMRGLPTMMIPTETVVMEAAFHLLRCGILSIPDTQTMNVKAARALLMIAKWLQQRMWEKWSADGTVTGPSTVGRKHYSPDFVMALIGPGGTGKTTILRCAEALIDHFAGLESVRKCAISNTAARLLGGDTIHALCKLPLTSLQQSTSRLSAPVLKRHCERWRTAEAVFMDEISMVAPEQLCQADVRIRQAKCKPYLKFGGVGGVLSGDFLQLPPVERGSLARRLGDTGAYAEEQEDPNVAGDVVTDDTPRASAEARQGYLFWRDIRIVISLSINIRAPGVLSRLQEEMRSGSISAEMWKLYLTRVLRDDDERLLQPPFSTAKVQYVVHRHSIRVRQSYANAIATAYSLRQRVYIVQAADEPKSDEDTRNFTEEVRCKLLECANPRDTRGLCSFLAFYIGMRLLLCSKDCVRYGLMKGCECILEHIVFAADEDLPTHALAGVPLTLRFMPTALVLRAAGASWELSRDACPDFPASVDRRGLFLLRPSENYIKRTVSHDKFVHLKRTPFAVVPADTRIVYSAQGETFEAVIADMQRPPRMKHDEYWLACYVMLSRSTSLEGFLVLRPAAFEELSRPPPKYLIDEIDRLCALEKDCTQRLAEYLKSLPCDVPKAVLDLFRPNAVEQEQREVARIRSENLPLRPVPEQLQEHPSLAVAEPSTPDRPREDGGSSLPLRKRLRGKQSNAAPSTPAPSSAAGSTGKRTPIDDPDSNAGKRPRRLH